jgi:hypothetical protein
MSHFPTTSNNVVLNLFFAERRVVVSDLVGNTGIVFCVFEHVKGR